MEKEIPDKLVNDVNMPVLKYLHGKSAHTDTVEIWWKSLKNLQGVEFFCPDLNNYKYVFAYTGNVIIGYVAGMQSISFRLSPNDIVKAEECGGRVEHEIGENWVSFPTFQVGATGFDAAFWAKKAYDNR